MQCDALCKGRMHQNHFPLKLKERRTLWLQTTFLYADVNEALSAVFPLKDGNSVQGFFI